MSSLAAAKADNFYYPPDFDPKKHQTLNKYNGQHPLRERAAKLDQGILVIRFEVPFNIWCDKCGEHIAKGERFNAEKKAIGFYHSTRVLQFSMTHHCGCRITIQTDPKNAEYLVVEGARKKEESYSAADAEVIELPDEAERERRRADPLYRLEHAQTAKARALTGAARLAAIHDAADARAADPYALNKAMRSALRGRKREEAARQGEARALGLPEGLALLPAAEGDGLAAQVAFLTSTARADAGAEVRRKRILEQDIFAAAPAAAARGAAAGPAAGGAAASRGVAAGPVAGGAAVGERAAAGLPAGAGATGVPTSAPASAAGRGTDGGSSDSGAMQPPAKRQARPVGVEAAASGDGGGGNGYGGGGGVGTSCGEGSSWRSGAAGPMGCAALPSRNVSAGPPQQSAPSRANAAAGVPQTGTTTAREGQRTAQRDGGTLAQSARNGGAAAAPAAAVDGAGAPGGRPPPGAAALAAAAARAATARGGANGHKAPAAAVARPAAASAAPQLPPWAAAAAAKAAGGAAPVRGGSGGVGGTAGVAIHGGTGGGAAAKRSLKERAAELQRRRRGPAGVGLAVGTAGIWQH